MDRHILIQGMGRLQPSTSEAEDLKQGPIASLDQQVV